MSNNNLCQDTRLFKMTKSASANAKTFLFTTTLEKTSL